MIIIKMRFSMVAVVTLSSASSVLSQQFSDMVYPLIWPDISSTCASAMNTTVLCTSLLGNVAEYGGNPRLDPDDLDSLCVDSCLSSLKTVQKTIQQGCSSSTDVITYMDTEYPATFIIDQFIYTYTLACRRDMTTNEFCATEMMTWLQADGMTARQNCSDCNLGLQQAQLNSPFGYDPEAAQDFASLTSSCSSSQYTYTSPPPYSNPSATATSGTTSTTSSSATPTADLGSSCYSLYTVTANLTCNDIAEAKNVSTYAVTGPNGISDCTALVEGSNICLLGPCLQYLVQATDTCDSIMSAQGLNVDPSIFLSWNPNIDQLCRNIQDLEGQYICLSRPDGLLNANTTTSNITLDASSTTTLDWPPSPTGNDTLLPLASGTNPNCDTYRNYEDIPVLQDAFYEPEEQYINPGANNCAFIASIYGVSLDSLLEWNPILLNDSTCTLAPGYSYCVHLDDASEMPEEVDDGCYTSTDLDPSDYPNGTLSSCTCFTVFRGFETQWVDCGYLEDAYELSETSLLALNPWMGSDCDAGIFADLGYYDTRAICVDADTTSTSPSTCSADVEVAVTFALIHSTIYGQNDFVTGNISQLTSWSTSAIALSASNYTASENLWFATVPILPGVAFEYKYYQTDGSANVTWEGYQDTISGNRLYTVPCDETAVTINDIWQQ